MNKLLIDFGGGDRPTRIEGYETINIDLMPSNGDLNIDCNIFNEIERIKTAYKDQGDLVYCNDFLEHIPTQDYELVCKDKKYQLKRIYPRIIFMNLVWEVLKEGGEFRSMTPTITDKHAWAQDPTHVDVPWVEISFDYFSDKPAYERLQKLYGIEARFKIKSVVKDDTHLHVKLTK